MVEGISGGRTTFWGENYGRTMFKLTLTSLLHCQLHVSSSRCLHLASSLRREPGQLFAHS